MDRGNVGRIYSDLSHSPAGVFPYILPAISDASLVTVHQELALFSGAERGVVQRQITGLVTEVGGSAVSARVSLTPFDPAAKGVFRSTFCSSSGRYLFRNVPSGRYAVTATGTGGALRSKSIHVDTEL